MESNETKKEELTQNLEISNLPIPTNRENKPTVSIFTKLISASTICLLLLVVFLFFQNQELTKQISALKASNSSTDNVNSSISPTPTAKLATPDDWKTKTTSLFTFRYPPDWEESQDKATGGHISLRPIGNDTVSININDSVTINMNESVDVSTSNNSEYLAKQALGEETATNEDTVMVDGHSAAYQERLNENILRVEVYIDGVEEIVKYLPQDGGPTVRTGTLFIFMDVADVSKVEESRKTLTEILSTFKFIPVSLGDSYQCPINGWISCMPMLSEEGKRLCSAEAMSWYKKNCPDFKGAAM